MKQGIDIDNNTAITLAKKVTNLNNSSASVLNKDKNMNILKTCTTNPAKLASFTNN